MHVVGSSFGKFLTLIFWFFFFFAEFFRDRGLIPAGFPTIFRIFSKNFCIFKNFQKERGFLYQIFLATFGLILALEIRSKKLRKWREISLVWCLTPYYRKFEKKRKKKKTRRNLWKSCWSLTSRWWIFLETNETVILDRRNMAKNGEKWRGGGRSWKSGGTKIVWKSREEIRIEILKCSENFLCEIFLNL